MRRVISSRKADWPYWPSPLLAEQGAILLGDDIAATYTADCSWLGLKFIDASHMTCGVLLAKNSMPCRHEKVFKLAAHFDA